MSYHSGGMQLLIRRGFKFELKPNGMQIQLMKQLREVRLAAGAVVEFLLED